MATRGMQIQGDQAAAVPELHAWQSFRLICTQTKLWAMLAGWQVSCLLSCSFQDSDCLFNDLCLIYVWCNVRQAGARPVGPLGCARADFTILMHFSHSLKICVTVACLQAGEGAARKAR